MNIHKPFNRSFVSIILSLCSSMFLSSQLFADSATLEGTTLVVPHIKVFSSFYSVTI
jgi:hypothetical protein